MMICLNKKKGERTRSQVSPVGLENVLGERIFETVIQKDGSNTVTRTIKRIDSSGQMIIEKTIQLTPAPLVAASPTEEPQIEL
eukprot:scaffold1513_cov100-Amphora_coffeaeformis.AAC.28